MFNLPNRAKELWLDKSKVYTGILAPSPECFKGMNDVCASYDSARYLPESDLEFRFTNGGIRMHLPMKRLCSSPELYIAFLKCRRQINKLGSLAIVLQRIGGNRYVRTSLTSLGDLIEFREIKRDWDIVLSGLLFIHQHDYASHERSVDENQATVDVEPLRRILQSWNLRLSGDDGSALSLSIHQPRKLLLIQDASGTVLFMMVIFFLKLDAERFVRLLLLHPARGGISLSECPFVDGILHSPEQLLNMLYASVLRTQHGQEVEFTAIRHRRESAYLSYTLLAVTRPSPGHALFPTYE